MRSRYKVEIGNLMRSRCYYAGNFMPFLYRCLPILSSSIAGFFGRFLVKITHFYYSARWNLLGPIIISIFSLIYFGKSNVAECAGSSGEGGSLDGSAVSRWLNQGGSSQPSELQDDAGTSTLAPHPSHEEMEIQAPEEMENPAPEEPLMTLEDRMRELTAELARRVDAGLTANLTPAQKRNLIQYQLKLELLLEKELRKKGFSAAILHSHRRMWRNSAFTGGTGEHFLSAQSLQRTLLLYEQNIEQSLNFRRVIQSLEWGGLQP